MQNVEFKAELRDPALARAILGAERALRVETLRQTDTYFRLADGRLKRRETDNHPVEYIFYHREDAARSRVSRFRIYSAEEARTFFGSSEPEPWVVVAKTREVWLHDGVRIHLDDVDRLGNFFELESLVTPQHNLVRSFAAVDSLRRTVGPALGEPVSVSYSDLVAGGQGLPAAEPLG